MNINSPQMFNTHGIMEYWNTGILEYWYIGKLLSVSNGNWVLMSWVIIE